MAPINESLKKRFEKIYNKRLIALIISGTLFFVLVLLLWGMKVYGSTFFQDFLSNWLSTLLGVAIGIPVALLINRWVETRTEGEKKAKILKVLEAELTDNKNYLELWKGKEDRETEIFGLVTGLGIESWRAFYAGGELQWIKDTTLLNMFAVNYYNVGIIDYLSKKYIDLYFSDSRMVDQATLEGIMNKIEQNVESTVYGIQKTLEIIGYISNNSE